MISSSLSYAIENTDDITIKMEVRIRHSENYN